MVFIIDAHLLVIILCSIITFLLYCWQRHLPAELRTTTIVGRGTYRQTLYVITVSRSIITEKIVTMLASLTIQTKQKKECRRHKFFPKLILNALLIFADKRFMLYIAWTVEYIFLKVSTYCRESPSVWRFARLSHLFHEIFLPQRKIYRIKKSSYVLRSWWLRD
jgi:hypothetical protein